MKYLTIIFFTVFLSCNEKNNEYTTTLNKFEIILVNHFPKNALNEVNDVLVKDFYHYHNTKSLILSRDLKKELLDSLTKNYSINKLSKINDSCTIIVNDFLTKTNIGTPSTGKKSKFNDCKTYKIIPNFFELDIESIKSNLKLPQDFDQYILKSEKGNFSNDIDLKISSMPNSIIHGYSKGFALSRKRMRIIYWTIAW